MWLSCKIKQTAQPAPKMLSAAAPLQSVSGYVVRKGTAPQWEAQCKTKNDLLNEKYIRRERAWGMARDGNKKDSPNNAGPTLEEIQMVSSLTESTG